MFTYKWPSEYENVSMACGEEGGGCIAPNSQVETILKFT